MNTEEFESLVLDDALGELSAEASALLSTYLAEHPDLQSQADRLRAALGVTRETVRQEKCLVSSPPLETSRPTISPLFSYPIWKPLAVAALVTLAALGGFFFGKQKPEIPTAHSATSETNSPWARYELAENGKLALLAPPEK